MRSGIGHREAKPSLSQHLHVVTAVAKGHHFTVLYAPARLQDPQAVSFVHAGDNQVDTAVPSGHRHHDVAKLLMQQRLNARNFVVRDVKPEFEENIVEVVKATDAFKAVIVFRSNLFEEVVIRFQRVGAVFSAGNYLNAGHIV
ncbi:Uncharacterised protein [Enterobacter hormaechei]|nr:Uncharacterised protein [Enterobacter hormaechei]